MNSSLKLFALLITAFVALGGCASFDVGNADRNTTPGQASKNVAAARSNEIAWGGVIVNGKNLPDKTELEVVGYPLDSSNRPQTDEGPTGRFIVVNPGYMEVTDYAPGREITAVGSVTETREGKVGEAKYIYPVLNAKNLHLWPKQRQKTEPQFHIGIGILR